MNRHEQGFWKGTDYFRLQDQTLQGRVIHARLLLREFIATGWSACVEKSAYSIA